MAAKKFNRTAAEAGDVIAIPLGNKHWGAICILGADVISARQTWWRFYVVDSFWDAPPTPAQVTKHKAMPDSYGDLGLGFPDVERGAIKSPFPADFAVVKRVSLDAERQSWNGDLGVKVYGTAARFREELLKTWRERYDAKGLAKDYKKAQAAREAVEAQEAAERKANTTLNTLLKEKPFAHWREHWGTRVVRVVTEAFTKATKELIKLERKGTPAARKAVFLRLVDELNAIEERDGCIETGEREELVARIEEMARLVKLNNRNERLTGTRDW